MNVLLKGRVALSDAIYAIAEKTGSIGKVSKLYVTHGRMFEMLVKAKRRSQMPERVEVLKVEISSCRVSVDMIVDLNRLETV